MGYFQTWKRVMFNPTEFFNELPKTVQLKEPSWFYIKTNAMVMGVVYFFMILILAFFGALLAAAPAQNGTTDLLGGFGIGLIILIAVIAFPFFLLLGLGMLFVFTGILHLIVLLFGGKEGYTETFKALSYAHAPILFSWVPIVNWATSVYVIVLQVIAINKLQKLSMGKSIAVVLLPVGVFFVLYMILLVIFFTAGLIGGFV